METVTKSIKTKEDEYTFPNEESVERVEEEEVEKGAPWDEKFDRYLKWMIDDIRAGYPSKTEGIPEEFRCYRTK